MTTEELHFKKLLQVLKDFVTTHPENIEEWEMITRTIFYLQDKLGYYDDENDLT